jgi:GNAT superfamily N-acetyltransferase
MHRVRLAVRENRLRSTTVTEFDYGPAIQKTGRGWVVEVDDQIVAFAVGNRTTGNIWALFVDPKHEGQGHGRRLHDAMVAWLLSQGLTKLWLTTEPDTRAERFYKKAGWTRAGLTDSGEVRFERTSRTRRTRLLLLAALALLAAAPVIAWAAFKPVRIFAPTLNGMTCQDRVCVELPGELPRAADLQRDALAAVARKLVPLEQPPLTVFCSTRACYHSFGGGLERGATLLDWGVILPPESWVAHIVEHEYIHMLQAEQLGLYGRQQTPDWFKEGMPFLISEPPDHDLPDYARPLVAEYRAWEQRVGRQNVWKAAADAR